ncbi:Rz1-like lysis system protein LysC [Sphingomonas montanisoli]|uniref:Rz1-like lysis system protein LysC n=1 Tax=Sphingomonas montanisoli TaxID=2606412 RepID=UPI003CCC8A0B
MRTRHPLPLALLLCSTACGPKIAVESAPPPPALVADLPADPAVPEVVNEATAGQYIVDLRGALRNVRARYEALRAWATGQ